MDASQWNDRYRDSELVWSAGPNQFVEAICADLPPGRSIDLAAGEGRNALWLAERAGTVRRLAVKHRSIFDRLGPHVRSSFIIDPVEMPFALHLTPDPQAPQFRTVARDSLPAHDALIRGRFRTLFDLIDAGEDGDAAFFSRDLLIEGDTDAVVTLRNALDDVDGSIAADTAALFGPPGRLALSVLRRGAAAPVKGYPS